MLGASDLAVAANGSLSRPSRIRPAGHCRPPKFALTCMLSFNGRIRHARQLACTPVVAAGRPGFCR